MDDYVYGEMFAGRKIWENRVPGGKKSGDKCGAAVLRAYCTNVYTVRRMIDGKTCFKCLFSPNVVF